MLTAEASGRARAPSAARVEGGQREEAVVGPKDVAVFLHNPGKRFFHIAFDVEGQSGEMAKVESAMAHAGLKLLTGFVSFDAEKTRGTWSFFTEAKAPNLPDREVQRILTRDLSRKVWVKASKEGFLVDSFHFPLRYTPGRKAILTSPEVLSTVFSRIREVFEAGDQFVFETGLQFGKSGMGSLMRVIGEKSALEDIDQAMSIYAAMGWCRVEVIKRSSDWNSITLRAHENFECADRRANRPYSQFFRGVVCGALSTVMKFAGDCEERKCVAVGDDSCEFVFTRF